MIINNKSLSRGSTHFITLSRVIYIFIYLIISTITFLFIKDKSYSLNPEIASVFQFLLNYLNPNLRNLLPYIIVFLTNLTILTLFIGKKNLEYYTLTFLSLSIISLFIKIDIFLLSIIFFIIFEKSFKRLKINNFSPLVLILSTTFFFLGAYNSTNDQVLYTSKKLIEENNKCKIVTSNIKIESYYISNKYGKICKIEYNSKVNNTESKIYPVSHDRVVIINEE